jgi:branched-subunit amino acid ABC-type transport system permease component
VIPGMAKAAVYVAVGIVMIIKPAGLFGSDRSAGGVA